jgi:hypothetical protein
VDDHQFSLSLCSFGYDAGKSDEFLCVRYVPLPLGLVGPILLNNDPVYIPMATTEGCLVASTNRGCKAITAAGSRSKPSIYCDVISLLIL